MWEQANGQILRNQRLPKANARHVYLLSGMITCGLCGMRYIGQPVRRRAGKVDYYYRCGGRTAAGSPVLADRCRSRAVQSGELGDAVWHACLWYIEHPEAAIDEARRQLAARLPQVQNTAGEERLLLLVLAEKHQEHERARLLFNRGRATLNETERDLDRINQERSDLQRHLDRLRTKAMLTQAMEATYLRMSDRLRRLHAQLPEFAITTNVPLKQDVIHELIQTIRVQAEKHAIIQWSMGEECVAESRERTPA